MELSTVPAGVAAEAHGYLAHGGPDNLAAAAPLPLRHGAADRPRFDAAGRRARLGRAGARRRGDATARWSRCSTTARTTWPATPRFVEALCAADRGRRAAGRCRSSRASLRTAEPELLADAAQGGRAGRDRARRRRHPAGHASRRRRRRGLGRRRARRLDVPILQGLCLTSSRAALGGERRRAVAAGRGHPGRDPRVRRPDHHGAVLVQGDRRRRAVRSTSPTRSAPPGSPASRSRTPGCGTSRRPSAGSC